MSKLLKIAIYSGNVPSTTFIERLIYGMSKKNELIYIFGKKKKPIKKVTNVKYITYKNNKLSKLFYFLKYSFLLTLLKGKEKKKLDTIILQSSKSRRLLKLKYYPILYHKPDIFHLQWAKSVEDWIWVKEFGICLILSLRGAHINYSPIADDHLAKTYRKLFPIVNHFHAVSDAIAAEATNYGIDLSKISTVYSGLELNILPFKLKKSKSEILHIVSVGRSHWKKGYMYSLKAMRLLKDDNIKFKYTIVGVGMDEELLYNREDLGLTKEVNLMNEQSFEKVVKIIQQSDILLLPSVEEGIANVVLEAMALGTLVVTTNCGGMHEVINNTENGFLIPLRQPKEIANCLKKINDMTLEQYTIVIKNARKTIEEKHSLTKSVEKMLSVYKKCFKEQ